jgi:hypothetical protein
MEQVTFTNNPVKKLRFSQDSKTHDGKSPVTSAVDEFLSGILWANGKPATIRTLPDINKILHKYQPHKYNIREALIKIIRRLENSTQMRVLILSNKGTSISLYKNSIQPLYWIINNII